MLGHQSGTTSPALFSLSLVISSAQQSVSGLLPKAEVSLLGLSASRTEISHPRPAAALLMKSALMTGVLQSLGASDSKAALVVSLSPDYLDSK